MSTSSVVRISDYRGRREQRLRLARALHGAPGERARLFALLEETVGLLDSDRAALVWVDEYAHGLVHAHVLLDLLSDRPRRAFPLEPLRLAWEDGVPGMLDSPGGERGDGPIPLVSIGSTCAFALGSDGARAWFLVADGASRRPPLDRDATRGLMFLAGEAAAVLLHRDLDGSEIDEEAPPGVRHRFTGWAVLEDVEGREGDEEAGRRISARFLVARLLLHAVEDDFAWDPVELKQRVDATRKEVRGAFVGDAEALQWAAVMDALEAGDLEATSAATLALAGAVEALGHTHGACALYGAAYDVALAAGEAATVVEAGRLLGRLERRRGAWERALGWYGMARDVARERGDRGAEAVVLSGWGNVLRDKGNLPGARHVFLEGLEAAREAGDDYALGSAHHALMVVEQDAGSVGRAIMHGWHAAEVYPDEESRLHAMTALASCFLDTGELDAADDAYAIVLARVREPDFRFAAREALAHVAARRGQRKEFGALAAASDAAGWREHASVWTRAQILLFRGLSHEALAKAGAARRWLERARAFAEENGVNKVTFDAEAALGRLADGERRVEEMSATERTPEEMPRIRERLSAMREALAQA